MSLKSASLISVFLIGIILVIANELQGAQSEWRSLGRQEKTAILDKIANRLSKIRSVGIIYDWEDGSIDQNGNEDIQGRYSFFNVLDGHRQYQLKSRPGEVFKGIYAGTNSDFAHLSERSWNGSLRRDLDHRSKTGSVRGEPGALFPEESMIFSIIGRDHNGKTWLSKYQNRDVLGKEKEYDVEVNEDNEYRVTERPKMDASAFSRQIYVFDQKRDMAIIRCYAENVFQSEDRVFRVTDTFFDDFRRVNGFYIPFKIFRKVNIDVEPPHNGVQYMAVKDVTINDRSHDKFLRDFVFPKGSHIYDYILKMPVSIGGDSEEVEDGLKEVLLLAKKEINRNQTDLDENRSQANTKPKLTDNLVERDFSEKVYSSPAAKDRQNGMYVLSLILLGLLVIVLAVIVRKVMKKRSVGCGVFIVICCSVLLGSDVFANDTRKFQSYAPESLEGLSPEHRTMHENDLILLIAQPFWYLKVRLYRP